MRRIGCTALVVAILTALVLVAGLRSWSGPGSLQDDVTVSITSGSTLSDAAATLEEAGVVPSAQRFIYFARFLGGNGPVQAGEFEMPAYVSQAEALRILQDGTPVQRLVTIPEGMPSVLVHDRLMNTELLTGDIPVPEEGSILADSYSFERGETRAAVLDRMQRAMRDELARQWADRAPDLVVTTPAEAVTLASIVEKETAQADERPMVAGVYTNRLRQGMRLQADPTIIYPITRGRPLGRRIRRSEINQVNDYNTYAMAGLPRGPIANVGREALHAVLHPAETDALYFVADGSGGHIFAETLDEHNRNVERWYRIRRERGDM